MSGCVSRLQHLHIPSPHPPATGTAPSPLPCYHSQSCLPCLCCLLPLAEILGFYILGRQQQQLQQQRQRQRQQGRTAGRTAPSTRSLILCSSTYTRADTHTYIDRGWQWHAACAYILLFIFYFILYYAFCAFRIFLMLPSICAFLFCSPIRNGWGEAVQAVSQAGVAVTVC